MGVLIQDFINRRVWAVVGVSRDPSKYGNRIFHTLLKAGYTVYPVNPNVNEIDGHRVFPTLADLPEPPEVVDVVVPPRITEQIVRECAQSGLKRVWMQPGSESEEAIDFCRQREIEVVYGVCAMVHRKEW